MAPGKSQLSLSFPALSSPNLLLTALWLGPQDQLKQLQDILSSLSVQEESRRTSQQHLDQKVNSEAQRSSSLVAQLRAMVADREAKVRQLELEIGQLSVQVSWVPPGQCVCPHSPPTLHSHFSSGHCIVPAPCGSAASSSLPSNLHILSFLKHKPICGHH